MSDFPPENFWEQSAYATKAYLSKAPSMALIKSIEAELGYQLPSSYIELMGQQNGGIPINTVFSTSKPSSWAENHVALTGILGIGREKDYSLCGGLGSHFMMKEWGYPNLGIYFGDCPSAGHDLIAMDFRKNGKQGEPQIVHVSQSQDFEITFLADNFQTFIEGLLFWDRFE